MAVLSFGVQGQDQNWTTQIELSESDSVRTMAYLMSPASGCGTVSETTMADTGQVDENGDPILGPATITRPATPEEAAQNFARQTLAALLNSTVSWEQSEAAKAAAEKVPPIVPISV